MSHISSSNDSGNPSVSLDWETKRMLKQMRYYDVSITTTRTIRRLTYICAGSIM